MVLGLLVHVTPSNFFSRIRKSESFTNHIFSEQPFYGNYSKLDPQYKHCNFSRICLLVKMASKTVTRSIRSHFEITVPNIFNVFYFVFYLPTYLPTYLPFSVEIILITKNGSQRNLDMDHPSLQAAKVY